MDLDNILYYDCRLHQWELKDGHIYKLVASPHKDDDAVGCFFEVNNGTIYYYNKKILGIYGYIESNSTYQIDKYLYEEVYDR